MPISLKLCFVPGRYSVARLAPDSSIPAWVSGPGFSAIIRADDELTIVCHEDRVPRRGRGRTWMGLPENDRPFRFSSHRSCAVADFSAFQSWHRDFRRLHI